MRRWISVFINFCVHTCMRVCVAQRDAWLPIDVIIFHLHALISAWVRRYFLLFCLCYFVCVSGCACAMHMWMSVWYIYAFVCGCVLHKTFVSQKVPDSFSCFLVSWKVRKIWFPTKIPATKKLRRIKCQCQGNRFKSLAQIQSFISFRSKLLN